MNPIAFVAALVIILALGIASFAAFEVAWQLIMHGVPNS